MDILAMLASIKEELDYELEAQELESQDFDSFDDDIASEFLGWVTGE